MVMGQKLQWKRELVSGQEQYLQLRMSGKLELRAHEVGTFSSEQMFIGCSVSLESGDALHMQRDIAGSSSKQQLAATVTEEMMPSDQVSSLNCQVIHIHRVVRGSGEESYIDSDNHPDSGSDTSTQSGPIIATAIIFNIDASYYIPFAKAPHDFRRLQAAKPPWVTIEVLVTSSQAPPTRGVVLSQSVSRYACDQHVA